MCKYGSSYKQDYCGCGRRHRKKPCNQPSRKQNYYSNESVAQDHYYSDKQYVSESFTKPQKPFTDVAGDFYSQERNDSRRKCNCNSCRKRQRREQRYICHCYPY